MRGLLNHRTMSGFAMLCVGLFGLNAQAAEVCFHQAGTYGPLTVTRSGPCGQQLNYGGIVGEWMGTGSSSSSCTYTFSYTTNRAVDPSTLKVNMTAHSNQAPNFGEEAVFEINGAPFNIITADLDNSFPTGGVALTAETNGAVASTGGDGRGTVNLNRFLNPVTSLTIRHNRIVGSPNGTIYRVCLDDGGIPLYETPTVTPQTTNNASPTLTGTQDASNTLLTVTINNVTYTQGVSQGFTVNANGTWSLDLAAAGQTLPDNVYEVVVTSTNGVNTAVDGTNNELTVDTVAPVLGINSPTDNAVLNDNTPTISGTTTEPGSTVSVVITDVQGNPVETVTPAQDAQGGWSFDAAQLADGTYTIIATGSDAAGNMSVPVVITVTIDTLAPPVSITAPADGSLTNDNTPALTGTSEVGVALLVTVQDAGGNVIETLMPVVDAQGDWSVDASQLPDGTYTVTAVATDAAGNVSPPAVVTVDIDATPPTLTLATPVDGSLSNDNTQTVSGSVEAGATLVVEVRDAAGNVVETLNPTADAQGDWSVDTAALADGTYTVVAQATDAAGNTTTASSMVSVDTVPPTVSVLAPTDGSLTNDNTPSISGMVEPGVSLVVEVRDAQGTIVATLNPMVGAQNTWSVDAAQLPDGVYTVTATATDAAGNTTTTPANAWTIDTAGPALTVSAPADGAVTNDNTPDIVGTTEPGAEVKIIVRDANGNTLQTLFPAEDALGNFSIDTASALADGTYTLEVESTDAAGNVTSNPPISITIDTMAPAVAVNSPADGAVTNDDTPTIGGTSEPGATVQVVVKDANGATVQTLDPMLDAAGNWSVDTSQLPEGTYTIEAQSTDAAGNSASASPVGFEVDVTPPALSITTPAQDALLGERNVDVTGASEPNGEVVVEVLDVNGVVVDSQTVTADANGDWSLQTNGLANGTYTVRANAQDAAGNTSTVTQSFTVDSDEPLITIDSPVDASVTSAPKPDVSGSTDADAMVTVTITDDGGNVVETLTPTVDAQGNWSVTPTQDLADGTYTIEATATRPNGKSSSASVSVSVDTVAPTTTISAPGDGMVSNANQPEITGTSEPGATVDVTVTNAAGTVVFTGQVTADDQGNWSVMTDSPLADDTYTISAKGQDAAGNEGAEVTSGFTVDTNAPNVTIVNPSNGQTIESLKPEISGTSSPNQTVTIFVDGMEVGTATADAQGEWSFELPNELSEGEHTIEARATDEAGNEGSSGEITVTIVEPVAPITITSPAEGEEVTGPDVTVGGTGEPGEEITVTIGGQTVTTTVGDDGMWSTTVTGVPDGATTIEARAGDRQASIGVTVSAPDASTTYFVSGGGCSSTGGAPVSGMLLWVMLGLFVGVRRRKRC